MADLIAKGIMKQWMQGGVPYCSYQTVETSETQEVEREQGFYTDRLFLIMAFGYLSTQCLNIMSQHMSHNGST